jgi:glycosyltransferase involved in cell wall biosynthesis
MYKIIKDIIKSVIYFFYGLWNLFNFLIFDLKKISQADIVCFFPYYHTGGAEKVHLNIVKALAPKKVCVIFTLNSATKNFQEQFKANAQCIEINPILNKRNLFVNSLLKKSICKTINKSNNCKTVFGCNSVYFYQILPFITDKIARIDLFHNFFENDNRENDIINSVSLITHRIVINDAAKQDVLKYYYKNQVDYNYYNNIKIIKNGIDLDNNAYYQKQESVFKIGFIGRWCFEKRPLLFLEIAKKVKSKYPLISFVMAGTGMRSNLDIILEAGVEYLGEITDKFILNQLYKELNLVLLPSIYEGFPMVIMESMAQGVIPISTNVGGISEHIKNNKNGILIHELDENKIVEEFCNSIFQLIENQKHRHDLSYNSFLYAQEHFSIEKFNVSYKKILSP